MSCVKKIVELSNGAINAQDAKELLQKVDRLAKRAAGDSYEDAVSAEVSKRIENVADNIAKQKANIARNMVIKANLNKRIDQHISDGLGIEESFAALLEGYISDKGGVSDSVALAKEAVKHNYLAALVDNINKEGLLDIFNSGTLDDLIARELWAISEKSGRVTESPEARRIAEIVHSLRESQRQRLNAAGADIADIAGNVMPQRHDTVAMVKAGEDEWVNFMRPLLDESRSFGGSAEDFDKALRGAYQAMVTGIRLDDTTLQNPKLFQFQNPANLAKKMSQARQLIFRDYASWKQWNSAYGMKSAREGIVDSISFAAGNIALLERLGTNPQLMAETVMNESLKRHRGVIKKEGAQAKIQRMIDGVSGKNMIAADPKIARVVSNIKTYQNITKLGGAVMAALGDIPLKAAEYQYQGKTWLQSMTQSLTDTASVFKTAKDRADYLSLTGVYYDNLVTALFSPEDDMGQTAAKVQRLFFKLNGLTAWTDGHREAMAVTMSHDLALKKGVHFGDLDPDTARLFGNYNITESDWDTIRTATRTLDDGKEYVFAEDIKDVKIKEKLIGYYVDRQSFGVLAPTAREQRLVSMGTQRGTPINAVVQVAAQFKSYPLTVATKVWGRAMRGRGHLDTAAMAHLLLMGTAFGYMSMTAKDMLRNKTPKDPSKIETWYASMAMGGGLGILGDVLLNDGSGMGRSVSEILAGPTFGTIDSIAKIYSAGIRGKGGARQAAMTGIGLIPFNNLFYARAALDHMLLLDMQESLSPGYLRRMESNMRNVYGQDFLFK